MENKKSKARIFNLQKYNTYDGPGVRTIVFFKGCKMRCKWCSNPEGVESKYAVMYMQNMCKHCGNCVPVCPVGIHVMDNGTHKVMRNIDCLGCRNCQNVCLQTAIAIFGENKSIPDMLAQISKDRIFYDLSGGGVTLSGGEVSLQETAATALLSACKQEGINTAIETCGYGELSSLLSLAQFTDLFLYDIKLMDSQKHFLYTGVNNEVILENFKELMGRKYPICVRVPLIKGINDCTDNISKMVDFLLPFKRQENFKGVNLLPYHKMSVSKYAALGRVYELKDGDYSMTEQRLLEIEQILNSNGLNASIIRH
ncbi:MAG: choline TMA-lyase-activating enzyme [Defluviitaleaceae bacterium]|nr:choline TMA-lyase-activating enzyme [Defluviitaleaceae bacterium]